jgi:hypothetical protein
MKKVFFALAVVAMFSFVACNGNAAAEDTTAAVEPAIEEVAPEATEEATEAVEGAVEEGAAEAEAVVAE